MNDCRQFLQYTNESKQYCEIHIFKIKWEMTENWKENIVHDYIIISFSFSTCEQLVDDRIFCNSLILANLRYQLALSSSILFILSQRTIFLHDWELPLSSSLLKLNLKRLIHVVNISYSIMSFLGYQSFAQSRVAQTSHRGVTAVHSAKDR